MSRHILTPAAGVTPAIGFYLSAMDEVREQIREAVQHLTGHNLTRPAFLGAHATGALTLHIGEAEWWWIQCVVCGHELTDADRKAPYWDVLEDPEGFEKKGYTAEFCLQQLDKIRAQTRESLASFKDKDLERIFSFERGGKTHEHSLRWILHHLVDHEAQHKGQIMLLKRLLPGANLPPPSLVEN